MFSATAGTVLGSVRTVSVSGRGFTPEELAEQAVDRIISIGGNCNPVLQAQAEAFREQIRLVLLQYMQQAVKSNHTTLAVKFRAAGHPELVRLLGD